MNARYAAVSGGGGLVAATSAYPRTNQEALQQSARVTGTPYQRYVLDTRDIDMSIPIELEELTDGSQWPPVRMRERDDRCRMLRNAYEGDYSELLDLRELADAGITPTNIGRRIITTLSNLLMRIPPEGSGECLSGATRRALHDMAIHGSAFVERVADKWRCVDARFVWWTAEDVWVTVEPRLRGGATKQTNQADSLQVTMFSNGSALRWYQPIADWSQDYGGYMQITGKPVDHMELGEACFGAAYRQPEIHQGGWGSSLLLDLLTLLSQHALARARDTDVVDRYGKPILQNRGRWDSFLGNSGSTGADVVSAAARQSGLARHPREIVQEQQLAASRFRSGIINYGNSASYSEYLVSPGDLSSSLQLQMQIDRDMRLMSGVTMILDGEFTVPSGMSLKRLFSVADAEAQSLRLPLLETLMACDSSIVWEDAFSEVDDLNTEDVEDEATARRGENRGNE